MKNGTLTKKAVSKKLKAPVHEELYECEVMTSLQFDRSIENQKILYRLSDSLCFAESFKLNGIKYTVHSASDTNGSGDHEGITVDYYCVAETSKDVECFPQDACDQIDKIIGKFMYKCEKVLSKEATKIAKKFDTTFVVETH